MKLFSGRRVAHHVRYDALRYVITLYLILFDQLNELGRKPIMAAYDALDHAFVRHMVHAPVIGIALRGAEEHRHILGVLGFHVSVFQRRKYLFCYAAAQESARENSRSVFDQLRSFRRVYDLAHIGSSGINIIKVYIPIVL
ncbi:hypothetical protein SDC9_165357 [bioreactor metagenome]|uniref:Uncharacterized protein n=1 Tax=bioreactor metagenome TaxID=1076179 RepID=A0A645FWM7_9ZZZZ